MMGCPCISVYTKAVCEYTTRVHSRKIFSLYPTFRCRSLTTKPASQQRNTSKKYRRSDSIRCLVDSVFAYKKQFKPAQFMLHVSH